MDRSMYLSDNSILPRVQKYLESNTNRGSIDINTMADDLQKRYSRDYGKRKRNVFRNSVKKACQIVMANHAINDVESSSEEYSDESVVENQHGDADNSLSSQLLEMYGRNVILPQKPIGDNELIDISSDDSAEEAPTAKSVDGSLPFVAHMSVGKTPLYQLQGSKLDRSPLLPNYPTLLHNLTPSSSSSATNHNTLHNLNHPNLPSSSSCTPNNNTNNSRKRKLTSNNNNGGNNDNNNGADMKVAKDSVNNITNKITAASVNMTAVTAVITANSVSNSEGGKGPGKASKKGRGGGGGDNSAGGVKYVTPPISPKASTSPQITFKDLGGIDNTLKEICKLLVHVKHPEVYEKIGVTPPRGFLLHGPPGCGKTMLASAIAGELAVPLIKVAAPELVAGVSGESEERIRELFDRATSTAPCVLFIDEIDAITQNRQFAQKDMERRIVAQLLVCLDDLNKNPLGTQVLIIGATNNPHALDPALRRAGRFDREVCMGIPNKHAREAILLVLTEKLQLEEEMDFANLATLTPGFVGADLMSLVREAAMAAVNRVFNDLRHKRQLSKAIAVEQARTEPKVAPSKADDVIVVHKDQNGSDIDIIVDDVKIAVTNDKNDVDSADVIEADNAVVQILDTSADTVLPPSADSPVLVIDDTETTKQSNGNNAQNPTISDNNEDNDVATSDKASVDVPTVNVSSVNVSPVNVSTVNVIVNGSDSLESAESDVNIGNAVVTETNSITVLPSSGSLLEDLITWLHNASPLTDEQLSGVCISMDDFQVALKSVQPSAKREGFATVPDTTWDDIGSLVSIREELQLAILAPVKHAEQFERIGLTAPTGILLCGPPGCGKTLLAKAIANEAGINFISVKGPELLNMYVGESERAVRSCFQRARDSAPCVIFFDELDALCPKRSDSREGGVTMRVVNQMLTEMDGIEGRKGVFLLAASNRPDIIDPAVLRPGRLDKLLYVGLPTGNDRVDILRTITKNGTKPCLDMDVDLEVIGKSDKCDGYTGADLASLVREASVQALRDLMIKGDMEKPALVTMQHFTKAILKIRPSVTDKDQAHYEKLRKIYSVKSDVEEMELS